MDFRAAYKRNGYINFFRNYLLPEDFVDHSEDVVLGFKPQSINNAVKIGDVPSLELNIYEVRHPSENDPRVSLSRDAFRLLAQYGIKHALIIFASENSSNYRLSLVTIDLKWEEGKRVQKEYSNPRRYSFFLGSETKTHTPEEYLVKQGRVKDFDDLKKRFSIEVVNKDFYTQIAVLFTKLAGGKRENGRKSIDAGSGSLKLPSTNDDTLHKEFTVRLIGRLVFCWFLKKKRSEKNVSLLPEELLSSGAVLKNKGYYHGILEPLFFEILNEKVDRRQKKYQEAPWAQIPFLNGGLFTSHPNDFYEKDYKGNPKIAFNLVVSDEWVKELFDIFETYNFTIDENTSVDVELSIEPEMLGRIFENLLAEINPETGETARKATGSYYTPRPIVEYMVDESLKQYLLTKTKLDENKIKSLLTYEDLAIKLTASEKESVLTALDAVKVIDPACGSGAFPMGILQKMLFILQKVDPESEWWLDKMLSRIGNKVLEEKLKVENVNYIHKLGIIQNAIFGVDIQPIAVEISKLRFFLSLIVDEKVNDAKENRGIEPLPNLEFKFVCTNSLIGLPKKEKSTDELFEAEDTQSIKELKDFRDEYLRSYGIEKEKIQIKFLKTQRKMAEFYWKQILRPQADLYGSEKKMKKQDVPEFTRMLSNWDPFSDEPAGWFDPEWMFGIRDGFDIVIGNPPYGYRDVLTKEEKKYFREMENIEFKSGDSAELFSKKCFDKLTKADGFLTFIIPKKSLYGDAWTGFRREYWYKYCLCFLLDSSKAFENVLLEQNVFGLKKSNENAKIMLGFLDKNDHICLFSEVEKDRVFMDNWTVQIYRELYPELFQKISDKKFKENLVEGDLGLAIGTDFFSSKPTKHKLLKGIDIDRWRIKENRYLKNEDKLKHENLNKFLRSKIICQRLIAHIEKPTPHLKITATFDKEGIIITNTITAFKIDKIMNEMFWLSYINSTFVSWYAYNFIFSRAIRGMDFYNFYIHQVPIPKNIIEDKNKQKPFVEIVDKILAITNSSDYLENPAKKEKVKECEKQIDQMIYELYGLTKEEIEMVENLVKDK